MYAKNFRDPQFWMRITAVAGGQENPDADAHEAGNEMIALLQAGLLLHLEEGRRLLGDTANDAAGLFGKVQEALVRTLPHVPAEWMRVTTGRMAQTFEACRGEHPVHRANRAFLGVYLGLLAAAAPDRVGADVVPPKHGVRGGSLLQTAVGCGGLDYLLVFDSSVEVPSHSEVPHPRRRTRARAMD